jgi:hypothetical protein
MSTYLLRIFGDVLKNIHLLVADAKSDEEIRTGVAPHLFAFP